MYKKISCVLLMLAMQEVTYADALQGFYIGYGNTLNSISGIGSSSVDNGANSSGTRIYIGHRITPGIAVEGGYTSSAEQSENRKMDAGAIVNYSKRIEIVDVSFLIKTAEKPFELSARLGIAMLGTHTKRTENDMYMNNHSSTRTTTYASGVIGGVLYEYPVSDSVFVNAGYVRYVSLIANMDQALGTADFSGNLFSITVKKQF
jgi:hypothetical protein